MERDTAVKLMTTNYRKLQDGPREDGGPTWLADFVTRNRLNVGGVSIVSGVSRPTLSGLLTTQDRWVALTPIKLQRLVEALGLIEPLSLPQVRELVGLDPKADGPDPLRNVTLTLQGLRCHISVNPADPRPPHVYTGRYGTYVSDGDTPDQRLGRLALIAPI